jgi:hypothetical protein
VSDRSPVSFAKTGWKTPAARATRNAPQMLRANRERELFRKPLARKHLRRHNALPSDRGVLRAGYVDPNAMDHGGLRQGGLN